ncbi:MAG: FAD-dependent oxidoreductase [Coriobacteriia bacterium]|nr:FAD-dependent oxidoreductase [Coriobacteriia bacterium]
MKLAVVGSGISGMSAAWLLSREHEVDVLEAEDRLGGHTHTVDVSLDGQALAADTGFMVFNHRTYPNLIRLFEHLGIEEQDADMSFSVQHLADGLEWRGDLAGLFAQPRNLTRPAFWGMLADVLKLSRSSESLLADPAIDSMSLGELLAREGYGRAFTDWYLVPMGAAIWSTPAGGMLEFPAGTFLRFCNNHGLLHVTGKPLWKSVPGGARRYTLALAERVSGRVRTSAEVARVERFDDRVELRLRTGETLSYDGVVLASHADQSLAMLADPDEDETRVLSAFGYEQNDTVLHTDASQLPRSRRAWAAWNYVSDGHGDAPVAVHYQLNVLQQHRVPTRLLVSLNSMRPIDESKIVKRFGSAHPQFTAAAIAAQKDMCVIQGGRRTWYAGAWQRYGFHEDGCVSGLRVAGLLGIAPPWGRVLDPAMDGSRS